MRHLAAVIFLCVAAITCWAQSAELNVLPLPASASRSNSEFLVPPRVEIALNGAKDARLNRAADRFVTALAKKTAIPFAMKPGKAKGGTITVHIDRASNAFPELGEDESYKLAVTPAEIRIDAPTTLGAMHGLQTLLQLVHAGPNGIAAPAVTVEDRPRFPWRGLMIDACRHWMPVEIIKRELDAMEQVKMNVLHWHLSENQGFRVESKVFPKLQELGSDGFYYTQADIRDIVNYANDRGIRVVPEFDTPGHATAWFVGYPELGSGPGPYQIEREFGIFDPAMDPTKESTYKFLDKFVGEIGALFPDAYWHIGGDEVNGKEWNANPKIKEFMAAHNLKDNDALQAYFNKRLEEILRKHKKKMVGWDEIFTPDLPKTIVVQSWRGPKSLAETARQGYDSLLSHGYYLDMLYPAAQFYGVDPFDGEAAALSADERKHVLGGEACMWAELITPETIDSRVWPNAAAVAERLWSPPESKDLGSMYRRLTAVSQQLGLLGTTHESSYLPMLERLAGPNAAALKILADVVEPTKEYSRVSQEGKYNAFTPLNRLPDAARPESFTALAFGKMVDNIIAGTAQPVERNTARLLLTAWRDNHVRLAPTLNQNALLKEDVPISENLSAVGVIGLEALDMLEGRGTAVESWRAQQTALLSQFAKPNAELLLKVVAPVEKLVAAAGAK
jgi:hexosaminidase